MVLFELYCVLALSVGIWACIEFIPEIRATLFEQNRLDDVMYNNPFATFIAMLVISTIFAPLVVPSILVPRLRAKCIESMTQAV